MFFEKTVVPVLDRLDAVEIGMVVDILNLLLTKNNLKGNVFHCMRTFHLVQIVCEYVRLSPPDVVPQGGLQGYDGSNFIFQLINNFLI